MNSETPRILIVRLSAVGDTVLTMPVLCALRDHFPQAHLAWVVQGAGASLLRGHRALDELIVVPKDVWKSPRAFLEARQTIKRRKFDIVVETQGLTKSAILGWSAGVPSRIGFARGPFCGRELSTMLNNQRIRPTATHVVDQQLELLRPLGVNEPHVRFDVPRLANASEAIDAILARHTPADEYVLIQPGAGWASKLWPTDRYAAVAAWLGRRHGLRSLILWSGAEEQKFAAEIVDASEGAAIATPPTTLPEAAELARRARFFLGPDTGPLHLAAACGTPCLGLYGPMPATRCGPYGSQHMVLQNACLEGGTRNRRRAGNDSMKAISVADVCGAAETLLSRNRVASAA